MTREEIMKMEAGPELDSLVAEKVMGWKLVNYETYEPAKTKADYADAANNDGWMWEGMPGDGEAWQWKPSTDISAAWQVVEKMRAEEIDFNLIAVAWSASARLMGGNWNAKFDHYNASAETAPLAICRAALLAVMEVA